MGSKFSFSNSGKLVTGERPSARGSLCGSILLESWMRTNPDQLNIRLFYCYSHVDEELRDSLATHLSALKRAGVIDEWHDRRITAGSEWKGLIDKSLDEAAVVLLLISADFLASDYCYDVEMQRALQRHEAKEAVVIPVILRPVDWSDAPFAKLQALPKDARPVTTWVDRDEAFTDVAKGIRAAISGLHVARRSTADSRGDSSGEEYETDEEEGLLDLVEQANREFKLLTEVTTRMAKAIAELGEKANATTGQLQPDQERKVDPARAKPIVDQMASYMSDFAGDLEGRVQEFAEARERALEAVRRASELAPDFEERGVRGLQSNIEQLNIFRASIPKTREQIESLRTTIARLPRLTTKLNRAKRASVRSLDALQEQLDLAMKDTDSVKGRIAEVLDMFVDLLELVATLRGEGFNAKQDLFRGQVGLLILQSDAPLPTGDFFPLWELNENLNLLAERDFTAIKAQRPTDWSPVRDR